MLGGQMIWVTGLFVPSEPRWAKKSDNSLDLVQASRAVLMCGIGIE